ncbi:MAG: c-type cytochrome [Pseudomonadota bacterium]
MSDAHNEEGAGIKTPKQLAAAVAAAFLVPIIGIVLLVQYVVIDPTGGAGSTAQTPEAVVSRIRPIADRDFVLKDVNAPRILQTGTQVYTAACAACHTAGVAGAPKLGDTAAWSVRIAKGYDTLVKHAVGGIGAMPAKGGNADLDDVEVARAVAYMGNQVGAKFVEPEAPAAAPAAAAAETATPAPAAMPAAASPAANVTPPAASTSSAANAAPVMAVAAAPAASMSAATTPSAKSATAALSVETGKKIYESACAACHGAGIAGAPKFADKTAWVERIKQGNPVLYEHAIKGYVGKAGVMPAKGGSSASDDEVKAAVDYMTAAVK